MADFPTLNWERDLVDGLVKAGNINAGETAAPSPEREKAMANLAEPIAEAIKHGGVSIHWVASLTVAELNSMESPEIGGVYGVKDSGVLVNKDGSRIPVGPNDAVIWNGEEWGSFIDIDLSDYAKKTELAAHVNDLDNPHHVTADQVGAYTKDEVDAEIKKESDARELYDDQLREAIEALEEKTGDFVTGEEVSEAISAEADARIQEDIAINARIDLIPQTDWNETDEGSMAYLANHPTPISDIDIEALFS